jgi:hypothetical protein
MCTIHLPCLSFVLAWYIIASNLFMSNLGYLAHQQNPYLLNLDMICSNNTSHFTKFTLEFLVDMFLFISHPYRNHQLRCLRHPNTQPRHPGVPGKTSPSAQSAWRPGLNFRELLGIHVVELRELRDFARGFSPLDLLRQKKYIKQTI